MTRHGHGSVLLQGTRWQKLEHGLLLGKARALPAPRGQALNQCSGSLIEFSSKIIRVASGFSRFPGMKALGSRFKGIPKRTNNGIRWKGVISISIVGKLRQIDQRIVVHIQDSFDFGIVLMVNQGLHQICIGCWRSGVVGARSPVSVRDAQPLQFVQGIIGKGTDNQYI